MKIAKAEAAIKALTFLDVEGQFLILLISHVPFAYLLDVRPVAAT